jgi:hypothetical protein
MIDSMPKDSWMAIGVLLRYDRDPVVVRNIDISVPTHKVLNEHFEILRDMFIMPLYDWLRNSEKRIVGVRFIHENSNGYDHILGRRNVVDHTADGWPSSFSIFFGSEREFEPKEHSYADFGGNELYFGENGSTMITFDLLSNEKFLGE